MCASRYFPDGYIANIKMRPFGRTGKLTANPAHFQVDTLY
jgi:hypothetical protein